MLTLVKIYVFLEKGVWPENLGNDIKGLAALAPENALNLSNKREKTVSEYSDAFENHQILWGKNLPKNFKMLYLYYACVFLSLVGIKSEFQDEIDPQINSTL